MVCTAQKIRLILIVMCAILGATRTNADPPQYFFTNISDRVADDYSFLVILKINNAGQILTEHSLWTPGGGMTTLDFSAYDINDHGQVSGSIGWRPGSGSYYETATAVRWTAAGGVEPIGEGAAVAINNLGEVAGNSIVNLNYQAWRWSAAGGRQDMPQFGTENRHSIDINDEGTVTGTSYTPIVWRWVRSASDAEEIKYPAFGAAINNRGQITGQVLGNLASAFLYTPGEGMRDLGRLPAANSESGITTTGRAINNLSHVVGTATDDIDTDRGTAWLWTPEDGLLNLNELSDASDAGFILRNAMSINDAGQIIGWAETKPIMEDDVVLPPVVVPFLLTPVPEPGMLGAVVGIGLVARRRRRR